MAERKGTRLGEQKQGQIQVQIQLTEQRRLGLEELDACRETPLLPGAAEAVASLAARWPLGLASSANRELIDLVLELGGLGRFFRTTVSSEEVARGKPAADVYLEAARRLGVPPTQCAAVEDSSNGLRAAAAAGMRVIALPNRAFPPEADALRAAAVVIDSLDDLRPALIAGLADPA